MAGVGVISVIRVSDRSKHQDLVIIGGIGQEKLEGKHDAGVSGGGVDLEEIRSGLGGVKGVSVVETKRDIRDCIGEEDGLLLLLLLMMMMRKEEEKAKKEERERVGAHRVCVFGCLFVCLMLKIEEACATGEDEQE